MDSKNIYQRINAVMKKVKYVKKDASVQGYKAVTHDQVISVCREELVNQGVVIVPNQIAHDMLITKDQNNKMHLYESDYCIDFVNMDNPTEMIHVNISSQAQDNGDKAPGKALSYAVKYAILKVLCLETGENDESRAEEFATLTETQTKGIDALLKNNEDLKSRVLGGYGVEQTSELLKKDYNAIVAGIKRAKSENN
jgi:hypothetical protein